MRSNQRPWAGRSRPEENIRDFWLVKMIETKFLTLCFVGDLWAFGGFDVVLFSDLILKYIRWRVGVISRVRVLILEFFFLMKPSNSPILPDLPFSNQLHGLHIFIWMIFPALNLHFCWIFHDFLPRFSIKTSTYKACRQSAGSVPGEKNRLMVGAPNLGVGLYVTWLYTSWSLNTHIYNLIYINIRTYTYVIIQYNSI